MTKEKFEFLAKEIVDSAITVHKEMGPGLLESIYESCLVKELQLRGIKSERQVQIPLYYKGNELTKDFRIDLLIENEIVIELKAVEHMLPVFDSQIISYLRLTNKKLGFLINFNVPLLKDGLKRFVNNY